MTGAKDHVTVTVRAFATLREVMDRELRCEYPSGVTVGTLLRDLVQKYNGLGALLFSDPETLRDYVNILVNGRNMEFLAGLSTPLADGDTIALFPPAAGG
ncbi:ubiquitin-like small modifier protein 1 [Methanoregula sp. PtaB.Bin085]|uniref:ubiquitin-like small modifier protein 1 n=1 Tax=Methanoregula sp. PtaB.Bin085 TaxID=1811680 RepID=UPI0009D29C54|nr:ubiquitin-like small modifier protein 1 [Methanoregula sp. PtaB.Bin085]OPX64825.1 MAG: Small archaeal modifier protein 1 [Methanoregula sp. PtaB.Bin085]